MMMMMALMGEERVHCVKITIFKRLFLGKQLFVPNATLFERFVCLQ